MEMAQDLFGLTQETHSCRGWVHQQWCAVFYLPGPQWSQCTACAHMDLGKIACYIYIILLYIHHHLWCFFLCLSVMSHHRTSWELLRLALKHKQIFSHFPGDGSSGKFWGRFCMMGSRPEPPKVLEMLSITMAWGWAAPALCLQQTAVETNRWQDEALQRNELSGGSAHRTRGFTELRTSTCHFCHSLFAYLSVGWTFMFSLHLSLINWCPIHARRCRPVFRADGGRANMDNRDRWFLPNWKWWAQIASIMRETMMRQSPYRIHNPPPR